MEGHSSSIKVHKSAISQLKCELLQAQSSWLIGLHRTTCVLSSVQRKDSTNEEFDFIRTHVPNGLDVLGIALSVEDNENEDSIKKLSNTLSSINNTFQRANIAATFNLKSQKLSLYVLRNDRLEPVSYEVAGNECLNGVSVWHCEAKVPITACYQEGFFKEGLSHEVDSTIQDFKSENIYFLVNDTTLFSRKQGEQLTSDFKTDNNTNTDTIINCTIVQNRSGSTIKTSPYIYYAAGQNHKATKLQFNLSVLVYTFADETLSQVAEKLVESLSSQARAICTFLSNTNEYLKIQVTPYHYLNSYTATYITALYPVRSTEPNEDYLRMACIKRVLISIVSQRQEIHTRFGFPNDRPLVRFANAFSLKSTEVATTKFKHITDVHTALGLASQINGGTQYLVDGSYEYYHYSQDNFNDNGWGCAYRSMQTLCSWFRMQQYIQQPVPTHPEIQSTLVKIGDKPKTFIGSSNWIGAIEISLCLQHLYGITCNIMHIGSGSEIVTKARELSVHFQQNGTPVMIGGGVLAYTLLGIDWNEKTGDIRFLILDPHYVGNDDLKTIKEKGWCGWKTAELFRKDSFYNLCLPQRPKQL